jgi:hypothetical protein
VKPNTISVSIDIVLEEHIVMIVLFALENTVKVSALEVRAENEAVG